VGGTNCLHWLCHFSQKVAACTGKVCDPIAASLLPYLYFLLSYKFSDSLCWSHAFVSLEDAAKDSVTAQFLSILPHACLYKSGFVCLSSDRDGLHCEEHSFSPALFCQCIWKTNAEAIWPRCLSAPIPFCTCTGTFWNGSSEPAFWGFGLLLVPTALHSSCTDVNVSTGNAPRSRTAMSKNLCILTLHYFAKCLLDKAIYENAIWPAWTKSVLSIRPGEQHVSQRVHLYSLLVKWTILFSFFKVLSTFFPENYSLFFGHFCVWLLVFSYWSWELLAYDNISTSFLPIYVHILFLGWMCFLFNFLSARQKISTLIGSEFSLL
jgi:hypothetical protein